MACKEEIHLGDIGTELVFTINECVAGVDTAVDVSTATAKQIKLVKPSGASILDDAAFVTDGTDGKIKYTTLLNDLDEIGKWYAQAIITFSATKKWYSSKTYFKVFDNI